MDSKSSPSVRRLPGVDVRVEAFVCIDQCIGPAARNSSHGPASLCEANSSRTRITRTLKSLSPEDVKNEDSRSDTNGSVLVSWLVAVYG